MRQARARGGTNRSTTARAGRHLPPHLRSVQQALVDLVDEVRTGKATPQEATAVAALASRLLDLSRFSLEVGEARELEQRLQALEAAARLRPRWPASA